MLNEIATGVILAIAAAIFWGISNTMARVGLQSIKAISGAILTMVASLAVSLLVAFTFDLGALFSVSLIALGWFALTGVLHFTLGRFFFYQGMRYIGAARGTAVANSNPLFAITFAVVFLRETLTVHVIVGTLLIVGGLFLLLTESSEVSVAKKSRMLGYGFGLATALCWGAVTIVVRYQASQFAPPIVVVTFALLFGIITLLPATGGSFEIKAKTNRKSINWLLLAGVMQAIGLVSFYSALAKAPVMIVAPLTSTSPLFTVLCVHLFLRRLERITLHLVIGAFMVVAGSALVAM